MNEIPEGPFVNLGSGDAAADGWIHLDGSWQVWLARRPVLARLVSGLTGRDSGRWSAKVRRWDARRNLPFRTGTVSVVYASHLIEHLYRDQALCLLTEARRVLKAGGVCRVVVPDLAAIVSWYLDHRRGEAAAERPGSDLLMDLLGIRSRSAPGGGLLGLYRAWTDFDSHKWMYDEEGLLFLFRQAGFPSPRACGFLESAVPASSLEAVEKKERVLDGAGICVESRA